jgi:hypothetical protein
MNGRSSLRRRKLPQPAYKTDPTGAFKYRAVVHAIPPESQAIPAKRSIAATFLFVEEGLDTES